MISDIVGRVRWSIMRKIDLEEVIVVPEVSLGSLPSWSFSRHHSLHRDACGPGKECRPNFLIFSYLRLGLFLLSRMKALLVVDVVMIPRSFFLYYIISLIRAFL